jgi:hypothetical protein
MKYLFSFILFVSVCCISGCIDTEEKIVINTDNSGVYSLKMEMGKMIEMANQMGAGQNNTEKPKEKKDTVIYFKDALNASDQFTPAEKGLFANAFCAVKLDEANAEMNISINCPFANISQLAEVKEKLGGMMNKLKIMDQLGDKKSPLSESVDEAGDGGNFNKTINPGSEFYKFSAVPGKISCQIADKEGLKNKLANDSSLAMLQQMSAMTGEMTYKTIISLPSPVKKLNGAKGVLSDDKKTITYKLGLTDMISHPEEMEYDIEY